MKTTILILIILSFLGISGCIRENKTEIKKTSIEQISDELDSLQNQINDLKSSSDSNTILLENLLNNLK